MNKKVQVKKKKRKLRIKLLCKIFFSLVFIGLFSSYVLNLRVHNIIIKGTNNIKDVYIIEEANLSDYPYIYRLNLKNIKEKIQNIPLVQDVKVKRNIFGKLTININEENILFFYKYNNKYITSSGASIEDRDELYGYPTLINFTPDTVMEKFIEGLNKVDNNIILMINEIEYTPYKNSDGSTTDNNQNFTLLMNDKNTVMIDTVNIRNLNKYTTIIASPDMDVERGVIYLDTINDDRIYFKSYATIAKEKEEKEQAEKEKEENKDQTNSTPETT